MANRRITTCPVQIGGRHLDAGAQISMNWLAANRDGRAFPDPLIFRLDRDPALNFLYGAGLHVCPGAPLARLEMKILLEELLQATTQIRPATGSTPRRAVYPSSGFEALPLRLDSIPTLRGS